MFKKYIVHDIKGNYRLLILDGYGSHVTLEFDLFCKEYSIITLCMLLHSSHLLQLLNVSCFVVLKQSYRRQVEGLIYNRVNHIDKIDFLEAYYTTYTETINQANI